jgi:hypothetical protein
LLLVIGVLGDGVGRALLCVLHGPRKGLCGELVVRILGAHHLHDLRLGSAVVAHGCVLP